MTRPRLALGLALLAAAAVAPAEAGRDAEFPPAVGFEHEGRRFELAMSGTAVRRWLLFEVYTIAHYVGTDAGRPARIESREAVFSDRLAKQATLRFARDIEAARIAEAFREAIERNATPAALDRARADLERFTAAIRHGVRRGDRCTLRWLPGGVVVALFNDEEVLSLTSPDFAPLVWSIWFGEDPVLDPTPLLSRPSGGAPAHSFHDSRSRT